MTLGIPYASHARKRGGGLDPTTVICPVCNKRIKLNTKKDWESHNLAEYQQHYAKEHAAHNSGGHS